MTRERVRLVSERKAAGLCVLHAAIKKAKQEGRVRQKRRADINQPCPTEGMTPF